MRGNLANKNGGYAPVFRFWTTASRKLDCLFQV